MSRLTRKDLRFRYMWKAGNGDDPTKTKQDAHHLSRSQGYEMLPYLNSLKWPSGLEFTREERMAAEWMIKTNFKSTAPSRVTVTQWLYENFHSMVKDYSKEL